METLIGNRVRRFRITIHFLCRTPSCGDMVMTSYPVFIKLGINSKMRRFRAKVTQKNYQETGSCGSISYITFNFGRHLAEKSLNTSFPVFKKLGMSLKGSVLEQKLHRNTERKSGTAVPNHHSLFM